MAINTTNDSEITFSFDKLLEVAQVDAPEESQAEEAPAGNPLDILGSISFDSTPVPDVAAIESIVAEPDEPEESASFNLLAALGFEQESAAEPEEVDQSEKPVEVDAAVNSLAALFGMGESDASEAVQPREPEAVPAAREPERVPEVVKAVEMLETASISISEPAASSMSAPQAEAAQASGRKPISEPKPRQALEEAPVAVAAPTPEPVVEEKPAPEPEPEPKSEPTVARVEAAPAKAVERSRFADRTTQSKDPSTARVDTPVPAKQDEKSPIAAKPSATSVATTTASSADRAEARTDAPAAKADKPASKPERAQSFDPRDKASAASRLGGASTTKPVNAYGAANVKGKHKPAGIVDVPPNPDAEYTLFAQHVKHGEETVGKEAESKESGGIDARTGNDKPLPPIEAAGHNPVAPVSASSTKQRPGKPVSKPVKKPAKRPANPKDTPRPMPTPVVHDTEALLDAEQAIVASKKRLKVVARMLIALAVVLLICSGIAFAVHFSSNDGGQDAQNGQTVAPEAAKASTVKYEYSIPGPDDVLCPATEEAEFDDQGNHVKSKLTIDLPSPDLAMQFYDQCLEQFGDRILSGSVDETEVKLTVDHAPTSISKSAYSDLLKNSSKDFKIVSDTER